MKNKIVLLFFLCLFINHNVVAQVKDDQTGAWYMYFWNTNFGEMNLVFRGTCSIETGTWGGVTWSNYF